MTSPAETTAGPRPGAEPRGLSAVQWLTVAVGLLLLALAGVVGRDLWFHLQADGPHDSWVGNFFRWLAQVPVGPASVAAGIAVAVLGLVLSIAALNPRPRTHVRYGSETSIWLRPVDIARMATHTAKEQTGAHHIRSQATRKKLSVRAQDDGRGDALREHLEQSLAEQFAGLARPPRIDVRLTPHPAPTEEAIL